MRTKLRLDGHIRALEANGIGVYVLHQGDADRGMILLKLCCLPDRQCFFMSLERNDEDDLHWRKLLAHPTISESEAEQYWQKRCAIDPDLWVVELIYKPPQAPESLLF